MTSRRDPQPMHCMSHYPPTTATKPTTAMRTYHHYHEEEKTDNPSIIIFSSGRKVTPTNNPTTSYTMPPHHQARYTGGGGSHSMNYYSHNKEYRYDAHSSFVRNSDLHHTSRYGSPVSSRDHRSAPPATTTTTTTAGSSTATAAGSSSNQYHHTTNQGYYPTTQSSWKQQQHSPSNKGEAFERSYMRQTPSQAYSSGSYHHPHHGYSHSPSCPLPEDFVPPPYHNFAPSPHLHHHQHHHHNHGRPSSPPPPSGIPKVTPSRSDRPSSTTLHYYPPTNNYEEAFLSLSPPEKTTTTTSTTTSTTSKEGFISELRKNDIVCGRGAPTSFQKGNHEFRKLISEYQTIYLCSKRSDKPKIAIELLEVLKSRNARFVRRVKTSFNGRFGWEEIDEKRAYEKVCQALREGAPEFRQRMLASVQAVGHGGTAGSGTDDDDEGSEELKSHHNSSRPYGLHHHADLMNKH